MSLDVEDKGDGIKVTTVGKPKDVETIWRKEFQKQLQGINNKLGFIVLIIILALIVQFVGCIMNPSLLR